YRDAGYVVVTPMLRGENGQPGSFTMFYDEVDDVLAAADALAKLPYVDDKHIYVSGHSAGGTLSLLTAMASPRFRAAASFSGSPNQKTFAQQGQYPVPFDQSNPLEFDLRSPAAYLDAVFDGPVEYQVFLETSDATNAHSSVLGVWRLPQGAYPGHAGQSPECPLHC